MPGFWRNPPPAQKTKSRTTAALSGSRIHQVSWCRWAESNCRPSHYECAALPAELQRRSVKPDKRERRIISAPAYDASLRQEMRQDFAAHASPRHTFAGCVTSPGQAIAALTTSTNGVAGRPIRRSRSWLSEYRSPFFALTSQPAINAANPAGTPASASALA